MRHRPALALLALTVFLVSAPLALDRPGMPAGLKADEPAYFLMALSLGHDRDLRVEGRDLRRLFDEFPFAPTRNLILMTDDGWRTVYYGKPYAYSLFAAPAARLAGAGGMIAFNLALTMGMVWLGAIYLRRFNPDGAAALFSAGFFLLSAGFAYAFWLHPEVFNMAAVTASLFLVLHTFSPAPPRPGLWARLRRAAWNDLGRSALSGAALAPAVYNKPMLLALALPAAWLFLRRRRWKHGALWLLGLVALLAALAGLAIALTGHPSPYLGVARGSFEVCDPADLPLALEDVPEAARAPRAASWSWILRLPEPAWRELLENAGYFLWGRHTGLILYFPFAVLCVVLFLVHGRRSGTRRAVLASLALVATFFLVWIPFNWHGGGGFVGNRYFVNAYPAFLFLVTRIAPAWISLAGYLAGGLLLGPLLLTPFGRTVPFPTLQAHTRNFPFGHFPLELSLRNVPGYARDSYAGVHFIGRQDLFLPRGRGFWLRGATENELWLLSGEPLERLVFNVRNWAPENELTFELAGSRQRLRLGPGDGGGEVRRIELAPEGPSRVRHTEDGPLYAYRLTVAIRTGAIRSYTVQAPPRRCPEFPHNPAWEEAFYVGAQVVYLGSGEGLDRDLYEVEWGASEVPPRVGPGETFTVLARLTNRSPHPWPAAGPTPVQLSYHWRRAGGGISVWGGIRTPLPRGVAPGESVVVEQEVRAPEAPGDYVLLLDLVYEHVAWFSARNGSRFFRAPVEMVGAPP